MCLETTTVYGNCRAVRVHLEVCASHVEHTRLQLDNAPCPCFQKDSRYGGSSNRCDCKGSPFINAGEIVCQRAISKGYGENGFTYSFERGPAVVMKKKRESARVKAKKEEMEKEKQEKRGGRRETEMIGSVEEHVWKAGGSGGYGDGDSYRPVEEAQRQQKPKKVKTEKNHDQVKLEPLDEDVEM